MRKKLSIEILIFTIYSVFIGLVLTKTAFIFQDDIIFGFPAVTKDYLGFYSNYLKNFGLFRPLALIYYFFIYNIYLIFPKLTHLIPLVILTLAFFLIFKSLSLQGLSKKQSFSLGVLFLSIPFISETYAWFSANASIIVIFIFFLQIYLVEKDLIRKNLLKIILALQILSVFFYETIIFMSFALGYLLYFKGKIKNRLRLTIFSIIPIFAYFISKIIIRPQFETRSKLITIFDIVSHWKTFFVQLKMLFSSNYLENFWRLEFVDGLNFIKNNPLVIILLTIFFLIIINRLFKSESKNIKKNYQSSLFFWLLSFILSLIPLSRQTDYLPFRTLILPIIIFFICLFFVINLVYANKTVGKMLDFLSLPFKIIFVLIIFAFLTIQISMVNQYANQFKIDKKIVLEINKKLENLGFEHPYRSNLLLKNFSNNNVDRLVYGDYIYSLFHNYWSAEALLDLNSGSFAKVGIEIPTENLFSSKISKDELLKLKPLTIMSFTDNKSCLKNECLKIEQVIK